MTIPLLNQFIELVMIMFTSSVRMIPIVDSRRGKNAQGFNQLNFWHFCFFLRLMCFALIWYQNTFLTHFTFLPVESWLYLYTSILKHILIILIFMRMRMKMTGGWNHGKIPSEMEVAPAHKLLTLLIVYCINSEIYAYIRCYVARVLQK